MWQKARKVKLAKGLKVDKGLLKVTYQLLKRTKTAQNLLKYLFQLQKQHRNAKKLETSTVNTKSTFTHTLSTKLTFFHKICVHKTLQSNNDCETVAFADCQSAPSMSQ